jgi:hypothetical protein
MNKVLEMPAWELFAALMIALIAGSVAPNIGTIIFGIVLIGWLYFLGMATNRLIPSKMRFSNQFFIVRLSFSFIYIIIMSLFFNHDIPKLAIPFHIVATIFLFSCLWTCAKTIVIAETQKIHGFDKYIGTFFMLWFFPIGIWFVQPRLNRFKTMEKPT